VKKPLNVSDFNFDLPDDLIAQAPSPERGGSRLMTLDRASGANLTTVPYNWKDSWRYSVGTNYHYNDQWTIRGGLAYDETPVNDTDRGVRLPDSDRIWLSVGGQYKMSKNLKFDVGFTYILADSAPIVAAANATVSEIAGSGRVKGSYDASVTIFSGQMTYSF